VGAVYEDEECTDGRAPLSDFKGVVDVVLKHTLFESVEMGTSCGCKKHSLSFDWRGAGLCRRCLVGAGLLIDEGTMEGEIKRLPEVGGVCLERGGARRKLGVRGWLWG
jgi:hypothetical protein